MGTTEKPDVVSIDPRGARDLDDAVAARRTDDGWMVDVCLPDVASALATGGADDARARAMGTTRYSGDAIRQPMLPLAVVDGLTLSPDRDSPMIHVSIALTRDLRPRVADVRRVVHRTAGRLTYEDADLAIADPRHPHHAALTPVWELALLLHADRAAATGAVFDAEGHVFTDEEGRRRTLSARDAHRGNMAVMEMMILANAALARHAAERAAPVLFRNHVLAGLTRGDRVSSAAEIALRDGVGRHAAARSMRSMTHLVAPATLGTSAIGHHGLDLEAYGWFTSPLRRYVDIVNWRALLDGTAERDIERTAVEQTALIQESRASSAEHHGRRERATIVRGLASGSTAAADRHRLDAVIRSFGEHPGFPRDRAIAYVRARMAADQLTGPEIAAVHDDIGAVFGDEAQEEARRWIGDDPSRTALLEGHLETGSGGRRAATPVDDTAQGRLAELAQRRGAQVDYETIGRRGPPHAPVFTVGATWRLGGDRVAREAEAGSLRAARHAAAALVVAAVAERHPGRAPAAAPVAAPSGPPPKSALIELGVARRVPIEFAPARSTGPAHAPVITSTVTWKAPGDPVSRTAVATTRKEAERLACLALLEALAPPDGTDRPSPS